MKHALHARQRSITTQICMVIIGLVAGTVLLCWFLNTTFLEQYYSKLKADQLVNGFETVNWAAKQGKLSDNETDVQLDRLCDNGNIELLIISSDGTVIRSTSNDNINLINRFMDVLFGAASDKARHEVLSTDNYSVLLVTDHRMSSEYLVLWGTLDDGNLIMMRTALESIRESVNIANRFLAYIGICGILISTIIVILVTQRITRPIRQLTDISRQMTELDFTAKYEEGGSIKEIELLGQHMNQLSKTLERAIGELKTANNELKSDIEKKEQIDEMRKEFLSNVSHELKTPLALIQGYAEGLQECINDDEQSRDFYCEVIMDEAGKMNQMVQKLLTLNHLEFGKDAVTIDRFDITELIRGVVDNSSLLLQQNEIQLSFHEDPAYVWGDEFQIEEVITNYLSNAIHYAGGEKQIRIFYTDREDVLRVSVYNTGSSIPEEDVDKIWDKFYKVDKARTREYGGSGIGLSIVRAIMESHHRDCGVSNQPDGVEFWMELDKNAVARTDKE
ncbi:MAG: HAMP domain-containing sensor histidine kinase [bacterium]|nr:HAMP domain-containing sensor histidine kinase [bacterium]MDY4100197.1 HAMP domain-containing sensor histidine kinase [Lachnospiraceae bacterium]